MEPIAATRVSSHITGVFGFVLLASGSAPPPRGWDPFAHLRLGSFSTLHQSLPGLVVGNARVRNLHLQAREARLAQLRGDENHARRHQDHGDGWNEPRKPAAPQGGGASKKSSSPGTTGGDSHQSSEDRQEEPERPSAAAGAESFPPVAVPPSSPSSAQPAAANAALAGSTPGSAAASAAPSPRQQQQPQPQKPSKAASHHQRRLSLLDAELAAGLDYEVGSDAVIDDSEDPTAGFLSAYLTLRHFLGELLAVQRVKHELYRHAARDLLAEFREFLEGEHPERREQQEKQSGDKDSSQADPVQTVSGESDGLQDAAVSSRPEQQFAVGDAGNRQEISESQL